MPENILFFTYAKLPLLTAEELDTTQPDCIILDEFHRCGAQVCGFDVQAVLERYPNAQMLGLFATNIRYLDNQWDMANEFGRNQCLDDAESTPICTVCFSYKKNLEKYQRRIRFARSKAVQNEGANIWKLCAALWKRQTV